MPITEILSLTVGLILLTAALDHYLSDSFQYAIAAHGILGSSQRRSVVVVLPAIEAALGAVLVAGLFLPGVTRLPGGLATILFIVFSLYLRTVLRSTGGSKESSITCGCGAGSGILNRAAIGRSSILAFCAGAVFVWPPQGALTAVEASLVLASSICFAGFIVWLPAIFASPEEIASYLNIDGAHHVS